MDSQSLFESQNARTLDAVQVGSSFIYSPVFEEVVRPTNTVVRGPRGSGKTTMLKMLTLPALAAWSGREARRLLTGIDYVSVYIPADFTWNPEFRRPVGSAPLPREIEGALSYAVFRHHVLLALCQTIENLSLKSVTANAFLSRFAVEEGSSGELILADALSTMWKIRPEMKGIFGLKVGILSEITKIQELITFHAQKYATQQDLLFERPNLASTFWDDLRFFLDAFEYAYKKKLKWAVCFDEVEIAPDAVKKQVWQSVRSYDPRCLIKFSASPFDEEMARINGPKQPMEGNDYVSIDLAFMPRRDIQNFSQRMLSGICAKHRVKVSEADEWLGSSVFDDDFSEDIGEDGDIREGGATATATRRLAPGGFYEKLFLRLAAKDPTFKVYLGKNGINAEQLGRLPEYRKAAAVRKILAIAVIRDAFFSSPGAAPAVISGGRRLKFNKRVPDVYTGKNALFALCEGNPRWLLGLLRPLVADLAARKKDGTGHGRGAQSARIERAITSFLTLLATIQAHDDARRALSVFDLIEALGTYCTRQIIGKAFNPDPALSFLVDAGLSPDDRRTVIHALHQGALVLVPEKGKSIRPWDVVGNRVRVAYLLAPRYRAPLVLGRPVEMSKVLYREGLARPQRPDAALGDLFHGHEPP
jgi:hypothetical protein